MTILNDDIFTRYDELTDEKLILLFYGHGEHYIAITENIKLAEKLITVLLQTKTETIVSLICNIKNSFEITKKDVPQFSDINIVAKVPFILKNCGIEGVNYAQMGYMVRRDRRNTIADRKYGENHIKTACQMSLCKMVGYKAYSNEIGNIFSTLSDTDKSIVFPKLCLSIPFIQNYFVNGCSSSFLEQQMNILSESTKGRRRSNVNSLITIINEAIKNGI
nr:hypothetical protein [uncultured Prevotella sp.]